MQAFHELDKRCLRLLGNQALELFDAYDHDRVVASHADALGAIGSSMTHDFAETRLSVLQLPWGIALAIRATLLNLVR